MNTLGSNLKLTRIAGLALVALLCVFAAPAVATAQTPIEDQYAPGDDPDNDGKPFDPDPETNNTGGGGFDENGGDGSNGGGSGSGGSEGDESSSGSTDDSVTPIVPTDTSTTPPVTSSPAPAEPVAEPTQNKAQRDLETIATTAAAERAASQEAAANPTTDLLNSDSGGGPGMGAFLWVLLAATLAWAIGSGVIRHRQDGHTA